MHIRYAEFLSRRDSGWQLAQRLKAYANRSDVLVLGLPRGGIPVAYEIAKVLDVPLDLCLVRKLGVPGQAELAMGAIAPDGIQVLNTDIIRSLGISDEAIDAVVAQESVELQRRDRAYRGDRPHPNLEDRTVILVDDGIATGATMQAAIALLQAQYPARLIVAVPVATAQVCDALRRQVDEVVCLLTPENVYSIGLWYESFAPVADEEVSQLLALRKKNPEYSSI
ncbi:MAG: phosphoribosyltransferase [Cyanobacteria bacterium J06638_20]